MALGKAGKRALWVGGLAAVAGTLIAGIALAATSKPAAPPPQQPPPPPPPQQPPPPAVTWTKGAGPVPVGSSIAIVFRLTKAADAATVTAALADLSMKNIIGDLQMYPPGTAPPAEWPADDNLGVMPFAYRASMTVKQPHNFVAFAPTYWTRG